MLTKHAQYFVRLCFDYLNDNISGIILDKKIAEFAAQDDIEITDDEDTIINRITDDICLYNPDANIRKEESDCLDDTELKKRIMENLEKLGVL